MNVPGRVGDSPILGAGTYSSSDRVVSCTGVGEKIMVLCLAKEVNNLSESSAGSSPRKPP